MDLYNPREATYAERVKNAEDEFLSDEWLDRNIAAAEMMPSDHKIELTNLKYCALLAQFAVNQKHEMSANIWLHWLLKIKAERAIPKPPDLTTLNPRNHHLDLAHRALNGGLELEEIVRIFGNKDYWEGIYTESPDQPRKYWAWKGPVVPPWELATWGKKKS